MCRDAPMTVNLAQHARKISCTFIYNYYQDWPDISFLELSYPRMLGMGIGMRMRMGLATLAFGGDMLHTLT